MNFEPPEDMTPEEILQEVAREPGGVVLQVLPLRRARLEVIREM